MAIRDAVQTLGIQVRAGLHTGECEIRGDDFGGIGVHIGARVSALAGPNEVLVSSTLWDLVIGSGLEFEHRGTHQLKDVPGEGVFSPSPRGSGGGADARLRLAHSPSPDLTGQNAKIAQNKLKTMGFTNVELASATPKYQNVFVPANRTVVSIEPAPGTTVDASDAVVLKVTKP